VIPAKFMCGKAAAGQFQEGLARVAEASRWGYINQGGEFVIPQQFDMALEFSEGLAVVQVGKENGYINTQGKIVVPPSFLDADPFSEGLARVTPSIWNAEKTISDTLGVAFIDKSGSFALGPRFLAAGSFRDGYSLVETESHIGYVDHSGNFIWQGKWVVLASMDPLHLFPPESVHKSW